VQIPFHDGAVLHQRQIRKINLCDMTAKWTVYSILCTKRSPAEAHRAEA